MKKLHYSLLWISTLVSAPLFAQLSPGAERAIQNLYEEKIESRNIEYTLDESVGTEANTVEKRINGTSNRQSAEISIAVNPTNPNNLVTSVMLDSISLSFPIFYSNDGGLSWTKSNFDSPGLLSQYFPGQTIAGGGDPVFEYDAQGNAYFSWIYLTLNTASFDTAFMRMFWAKSTDGGATWTTTGSSTIGEGAFILAGGGIAGVAQYGDGIFDRQWFDVDRSGGPNDGTVYCTTYFIPHSSSTLANEGMVVSKMTPGSNTFVRGNYVMAGTTQFGNVVVNQSNGTVNVSFVDVAANQIKFASSTDGAQSFSTPVVVAQGVNVFGGGNIVHGRENAAPSLAIDSAGYLHLVWSDFSGGQFDSFYSRSTDGGQTWSTPTDLSVSLAGRNPFMPTVAADRNTVCISYYDVNSSKVSNYRYAVSNDHGASFTDSSSLSSASTNFSSFGGQSFFGDYNRSVMSGCKLFTTWVDGRNGVPIAYVAVEEVCNSIGVSEYSALTPGFTVSGAFPNPSADEVRFTLDALESGSIGYRVYSITGQELLQDEVAYSSGENTVTIHAENLSNGSYVVVFESSNGAQYMRKVQVKH